MVVKQKYTKKGDYLSKDIETIQLIQKMLRDFNIYDGKIDGIFGDDTEIAVKIFQKYYKQYEHTQEHKYKVPLVVDGQVGKETILAIDEAAVNKWKYIKPEDELVYDIKNGSLILLTGKALEAFLEEERIVNDTLAPIQQLRNLEKDNEKSSPKTKIIIPTKDIEEAKKKTANALKEIEIENIQTSELTEIRRLSGKKFTYIRSDKMDNHWRSYSLDVDDRKRGEEGKAKASNISELMTDNKFDSKKIKKAFISKIKDTEVELFNYDILEDSENLEQFSKWVNTFSGNATLLSRDKMNKEKIENKQWDASLEAQWLRFSAGASLDVTPTIDDILKGNFGLNFKSNAEFALFKGEFKANIYIPNEHGFKDVTAYAVPLGDFRINIATVLQKFAGVNAMIGANVGFDLDKNTGQLYLGHGRTDAPITINKEKTEAKAEFDLFAGTKATCGVEGGVEWKNPEEKKAEDGFSVLAKISFGGSGSIGAGIEGEFKISYDNGKFIIRAKAGIVCGVGFSGEVGFEVDTSTILDLVQFVYHGLMNKNYSFMDIIDPKAFENLLILTIETFEQGIEQIGNIYGGIKGTVIDYWEDNFSSLEKEENIAKGIINANEQQRAILKNMTPEGKGKLLFVLSKRSVISKEEWQEEAIMKILDYCQSIKEANQVFKSITNDNSKISVEEGKDILLAILDDTGKYEGRKAFNNWYRKLPLIPLRKGEAVVAMTDSLYFVPSNNTAYA